MNALDHVQAALAGWPHPGFDGPTVVVPTLALYPSNGIVHVFVDGNEREFVVHDRGGAMDQLHSTVGMEATPLHMVYGTARRRGVSVARNGSLFIKKVQPTDLAGAIAIVSSASAEVAAHLIEHFRPMPRRPLSDEVEVILDTRFPSKWRKEAPIPGKSLKQHRFDYTVSLSNEQLLLMDIVKPEASSVNAAVVAHLDVEQARPYAYVHRVIYDDREKWPAEALALLRVGATPLPLSAANDALSRLAA